MFYVFGYFILILWLRIIMAGKLINVIFNLLATIARMYMYWYTMHSCGMRRVHRFVLNYTLYIHTYFSHVYCFLLSKKYRSNIKYSPEQAIIACIYIYIFSAKYIYNVSFGSLTVTCCSPSVWYGMCTNTFQREQTQRNICPCNMLMLIRAF